MTTNMLQSDIVKKYQSLVPNKRKGINVWHMPKTELIRLVQSTEGNAPCYKGDYAQSCGQTDCCWYNDCKNNRK